MIRATRPGQRSCAIAERGSSAFPSFPAPAVWVNHALKYLDGSAAASSSHPSVGSKRMGNISEHPPNFQLIFERSLTHRGNIREHSRARYGALGRVQAHSGAFDRIPVHRRSRGRVPSHSMPGREALRCQRASTDSNGRHCRRSITFIGSPFACRVPAQASAEPALRPGSRKIHEIASSSFTADKPDSPAAAREEGPSVRETGRKQRLLTPLISSFDFRPL